MNSSENFLQSARKEFLYYKSLGEKAIARFLMINSSGNTMKKVTALGQLLNTFGVICSVAGQNL
jgi:hypothetical protein